MNNKCKLQLNRQKCYKAKLMFDENLNATSQAISEDFAKVSIFRELKNFPLYF